MVPFYIGGYLYSDVHVSDIVLCLDSLDGGREGASRSGMLVIACLSIADKNCSIVRTRGLNLLCAVIRRRKVKEECRVHIYFL